MAFQTGAGTGNFVPPLNHLSYRWFLPILRLRMVADIDQLIHSAVTEVFGIMLNFPVCPEPPAIGLDNGESHVAGAVGFIGQMSGVVYLYCGDRFARQITCGLLGLKDQEIEGNEMVNDAMGELTNMVVGYLKTRLTDRGMSCVMSIPSVVRGSQFTIEPISSAERRVYNFRCDSSPLLIEVMMKSGARPATLHEA